MRTSKELYPDYTAEIEELDKNGITDELLRRIIRKHRYNALYNKKLDDRYKVIKEGLPILNRKSRFDDDPINNQINNNFFGEIIDFTTGYFAGSPISYSYCKTDESEEMTGGDEAVEIAAKTLSDFVTRNNMYDKDLEMTKQAAISGYCGRLFYHDTEGYERVMIIPGYQTIILSKTSISEPEYGVRYFKTTDIHDNTIWKAEFYDSEKIYCYEGQLSTLTLVEEKINMYDYCPLQGIPFNNEMLGDAEKVIAAIDAYDRTLSDNSNDIEAFSSAYMVYENILADDTEIEKSQKSGAIKFRTGPNGGRVYFLTKEINDTFTQNHLGDLKEGIYKFSKTPDLNDQAFGSASGIALKFKILGLETKCGMFQAKVDNAGIYMFKLLASAWRKRTIQIDPLQCEMSYHRNFPLDIVGEAQAAQTLINTGMPKEYAWEKALSFISGDDLEYIMQLLEEAQNKIPSLMDTIPEDEENTASSQASQMASDEGEEEDEELIKKTNKTSGE
jgi:SPP1 family phage portal protein